IQQPRDDLRGRAVRRGGEEHRMLDVAEALDRGLERHEALLRIDAREMRERGRDRLAGLARRYGAAELELRMLRDEPQKLSGDVARAAEQQYRPRAHGAAFAASRARPVRARSRSPSAAPFAIALIAGTFERCSMMSMPTWLSVAGPVTTVGSISNSSRSSFTPPHAATGSFAQRTTAVSTLRSSGSCRIASTPYAPRRPSPSSNTITSGRRRTSVDSSVRVIAGAFFDVVQTMPRSVKIPVFRAPASSIARMSRRSATPVALNASTTRPSCRKRLTIAHAAAVLPEFMHVPASATTGTPFSATGPLSPFGFCLPTRAGTPTRWPRYGKSSTTPSTRQSNG